MTYRPEGTKKMTYNEFKQIIKEELTKVPTGLTWIFLLCAVVWIISWNIGVINEERFLIEKYGDAYREYMNRTARWIGIPKSTKSD